MFSFTETNSDDGFDDVMPMPDTDGAWYHSYLLVSAIRLIRSFSGCIWGSCTIKDLMREAEAGISLFYRGSFEGYHSAAITLRSIRERRGRDG